MISTLSDRKLHAIELISKLEDESLLTIIEGLLVDNDGTDWALELSKADRESIEQGLADLENGRTISLEEFTESVKARFP